MKDGSLETGGFEAQTLLALSCIVCMYRLYVNVRLHFNETEQGIFGGESVRLKRKEEKEVQVEFQNSGGQRAK